MDGSKEQKARFAGIRKRVLGFGEFSLQKSYYPELQSRIKELEKAVEEKTVLLKEIHHRVKNNLQVISSLLDMQLNSGVKTDPDDVLRAARGRVYAMGLVHEKLYQSLHMSDINFSDYIFELVAMLRNAYAGPGIKIEINVPDFRVAVDIAVPCGLIINELVTNALKYAYPPGTLGKVRIAVEQMDQSCSILIADDGCGFDVTVESSGLGRKLVGILVGQLNGTLRYLSGTGTQIEIVFPLN